MADKNSFILMTKYESIFADMSDRQAGILIKAIFHYVATGETTDSLNDVEVKTAFKFVKLDLDYNNKKYIAQCHQNSLNGKKGGAPKGNNNAQKQPKQPTACFTTETSERLKNKPNDNDNDVDVDNELVDKSTNINPPNISPLKGGKFTKPTVEQVAAYCLERNNGINAQQFVDFYASKGWKVGSSPMKDWQAAVRNWERRNLQEKNEHGTDYNRNPEPNKYAGFGRKI